MKKRRVLIPLVLLTAAVVLAAVALPLYFNQQRPQPALPQVVPAKGSQLLLFPIAHGYITAGYQNARYREKNGFAHYGTDIVGVDGDNTAVLASGQGVVLGTEFCGNRVGHIAVVRYDDVYLPQTGEVIPLIARYYHMLSLGIGKDDTVAAGQVIGHIARSHDWYNHIHIELDSDTNYPFNTPQVAEASSELLIRHPADGGSILDPTSILVVGGGQDIAAVPYTECSEQKDQPRYAQAN